MPECWPPGLRTTPGEGSQRGQSGREDLQISSSTIDKAEDAWIKATFSLFLYLLHYLEDDFLEEKIKTGTNAEAAMMAKDS